MPIYEYACSSCGKKTEVIQGRDEAPPKACPHCGGRLKKAVSAPAIQFKGSGFYITDYSRGSAAGEKPGGEASDKPGKTEKAEKTEKAGKPEKSETAEKPEKTEKKKTDKKGAP